MIINGKRPILSLNSHHAPVIDTGVAITTLKFIGYFNTKKAYHKPYIRQNITSLLVTFVSPPLSFCLDLWLEGHRVEIKPMILERK